MFYNFWQDEIHGIILEEGDWQARIIGEISKEDLALINNFSNVEKAVINADLSEVQETVVISIFTMPEEFFRICPPLQMSWEWRKMQPLILSAFFMYFIRSGMRHCGL